VALYPVMVAVFATPDSSPLTTGLPVLGGKTTAVPSPPITRLFEPT
jgi:hypothetical protein